jgi:hypothetical protein
VPGRSAGDANCSESQPRSPDAGTIATKINGTADTGLDRDDSTLPFTKHGYAIKIRGNPADKAVIDGNVFKHKKGDAIDQNGACGWGDNITNPIDVRPNNQYGVNPMSALGSADYAGDGQIDQSMATGVTWWAKSPVTEQWRYLNTMSERLPQLVLQKVVSGC